MRPRARGAGRAPGRVTAGILANPIPFDLNLRRAYRFIAACKPLPLCRPC